MASPDLLHKCEEFLLHPTVRALSLAQRVDFLEKKGLSPEEITRCLKSLEHRNGLSQLLRRTVDAPSLQLAEGSTSSSAAFSSLKLLKFIVKKYGVATLLLALLGYGYVQFKKSKSEQLVIGHEMHKLQHQKRMSAKVEALLAVVKHQQTQYDQAAELLSARVNRYSAATSQAAARKASSSSMQLTRGLELQALQSELLELKSAVVDTYLRPTVVEKIVEVVKELPIVLRPAEASVSDRLAQETERVKVITDSTEQAKSTKSASAPHVQTEKAWRIESTKQKHDEEVTEEHSAVRDETTMSSADITELFQSGQFDEELSTARSYRILFATQ
ncbi:uncharacterized protein KRP23_14113 [Phytophthora ramorum]|nr:hypothetical protein KRP23_14113 [Phytophthora ramorum]